MGSEQLPTNGYARKQEALAELTQGARPRAYGRGELLSDIEERDGFVYLLNTGRVGLYSLSRQGREILLSTFHDGDMVGLIRHGEVSDTCSYAEVLVDATLAYRLSYHLWWKCTRAHEHFLHGALLRVQVDREAAWGVL